MAAGRMSPEDGYKQVAVKVAPRIHVLHQAEPFQVSPVGNVVIIEQSDGLVLVDSGGSRGSGERVVAEIRRISPKPVKAVIITHWHNDHPLGLPAILAVWPKAQIIATEGTLAQMKTGKLGKVPLSPDPAYDVQRVAQLEGYIAQFAPQTTDPKLTEEERTEWKRLPPILKLRELDAPGTYLALPTVAFKDRYVIADREAPVEALFFGPGNTNGDAVIWTPKQRVVAAGDIVVSPIPYGLNGYPKSWIADLERLKALNFKVLVPGHGLPQMDRAYLDKLIGLIAEARAKAAPLAVEKLTDEEAAAKIDLSGQKAVFAGADPWLGYWFDRYAAPIAVAAYHEAHGDPIDA
ncbi:MAG: MBL fold metallo-hydrolase [Caulobacteraceae bacterium]